MAKIKIKSKKHSEYSTALKLGEKEYHIQTEGGSEKNPLITTAAYLQGSIIDIVKTPYDPAKGSSPEELAELMKEQHEEMLYKLKSEHEEKPREKPKVSRREYIRAVKSFLARKQLKDALMIIEEAVNAYPHDPFLLSYYGYLQAFVKKDYKNGMQMCKDAMEMLKKKMPVGGEFYYPVFLLNIGRVYLLSGRKDHALNAFKRGLGYDPTDRDLLGEIQRLGVRKKPPVPFLPRDSFINKYLGKALHKMRPK